MQTGPRDLGSVLAARYTLTEAGWAAAREAQAAIDAGELDPEDDEEGGSP